jgi:hypothetical protein
VGYGRGFSTPTLERVGYGRGFSTPTLERVGYARWGLGLKFEAEDELSSD